MPKAVPNDVLLLALDAAPGVGSVALVRGTEVLGVRAVPMRAAPRGAPDEDPLARGVDDVLRGAGVRPAALGGVACGAGPGGFTSLRIAASFAKGLAHATGCPFLAAPSLAWAAAVRAPEAGAWLVTLDALRGERYAARVAVGAVVVDGVRAVESYEFLGVHAAESLDALAGGRDTSGRLELDADPARPAVALGVLGLAPVPADLAAWEPAYGRLAEAQVRWEREHGPLPAVSPAL